MIVFDLQCVNGHNFEGWFDDNQTYNDQQKKGLITCPICSDSDVTKILSPCAIKTSGSSGASPQATGEQERKLSSQATGEQERKLHAFAKMSQEVAKYVKKNFDDVGADFSKEALKIH